MSKTKGKNKEDTFWRWFQDNIQRFNEFNRLAEADREILLDDTLSCLHSYSKGLYFEIGTNSHDNSNELVISAGGNKRFFAKAQMLVSCAPIIKNWVFIALKPAQGVDFVSNYKGIRLDPKEIYFLPLENEQKIDQIGVKLYFPDFDEKCRNIYIDASIILLETIIGERATGEDIAFVDVDMFKETLSERNELIDLQDLPNYLKWRKSKE